MNIPPSIAARLQAYANENRHEVSKEMLARWQVEAGTALAAVEAAQSRPKESFSESQRLEERARLSHKYLRGEGIEIGALHSPLPLSADARVRYVDLCDNDLLNLLYSEISHFRFVQVDVVDDGEKLERFAESSVDFVIANHFLEHCQDPLGAICAHVRVLRRGGILYCALPDCRRTFDSGRARTTFAHVWKDHVEGPGSSRRAHYQDWSANVRQRSGPEHEAYWRLLDALRYSIHFHVWTPDDVIELFIEARKRLDLSFELLEFLVNVDECVLIARKS